jgi:hypothetical protein
MPQPQYVDDGFSNLVAHLVMPYENPADLAGLDRAAAGQKQGG